MLFILIGLGIWIYAFFYHTATGAKIRKECYEFYVGMDNPGPHNKDEDNDRSPPR